MKKTIYGIVGDGLLATHLIHYFDLEEILYTRWSRKRDSLSPNEILHECNIILLAISDDSLKDFISNHFALEDKTLIHFSGTLSISGTISLHPLMTFSKRLYTLKEYRKIPFVGEKGNSSFKVIFPMLTNSYYEISSEKKTLYHALCVISGNFTTLLWQKTITDFESELGLPNEILTPYLENICQNLIIDPLNSLTGPIKRGDKKTINKNIKALKSPIWKKIYSLFNKAYTKEIK